MNAAAKGSKRRAVDPPDWDRIAGSKEFQDLLAVKKLFIIPAFVFFFAFYLGLLILVGYAPGWMSTPVIGSVNVAYLLALAQFLVGWIIAWLYVKASSKFDKLTKDLLGRTDDEQGGR